MAIYYVNSADGDNADDGSTWALAKATLENLVGTATGGDTIYVASGHSQTTASALSLQFTGTSTASPITIISASTGAEPPTTYTAGAVIESTAAASAITINPSNSGYTIWWGVTLRQTKNNINLLGTTTFHDCRFEIGASNKVVTTAGGSVKSEWFDCVFKPLTTSAGIKTAFLNLKIRGLTIDTATAAPDNLFSDSSNLHGLIQIEASDLTGLSATGDLFDSDGVPASDNDGSGTFQASGLLIPSGTGIFATAPTRDKTRYELYSFGSGDEFYNVLVQDARGKAEDDTSNHRDATYDGSSSYSLKVTPTASSDFNRPFRVKIWEGYAAANATFTAHVAYDSASTLQDDEIWIEVEAPDATNQALRNVTSSRAANPLATAANIATAGSGWTISPSMANENQDSIVQAVTSGAGVAIVTLCYGPAATSPVVYADPEVDIT